MFFLPNKLPLFKGKLRIFKFLIQKFLNISISRILKVKHGLIFHVPNLQENLSLELMVNGIYESHIVNYLVNKLPLNGCMIDVGANIGTISIFVAKLRPDVKIYAFEASPRIFNFLEKNVTVNKLTNVFIYNIAIHEEDNTKIKFYAPIDKFGKGSFSPVFTKIAEEVSTKRLDTFFLKQALQPDIIKVDVEGYEYTVFKSMQNYLKVVKQKPQILFEFVDWAEKLSEVKIAGSAQRFLVEEGYEIFKMGTKKIHLEKIETILTIGSADLLAK